MPLWRAVVLAHLREASGPGHSFIKTDKVELFPLQGGGRRLNSCWVSATAAACGYSIVCLDRSIPQKCASDGDCHGARQRSLASVGSGCSLEMIR